MMLPTDPYEIDFSATNEKGEKIWQEENMDVIEQIQTAQHGSARSFKTVLLTGNRLIMCKYFATEPLAWAYGMEWRNKNPEHNFRIENMTDTIRLNDLQNIKLDGIDRKDYPDFEAIESVCGADVDTDMER